VSRRARAGLALLGAVACLAGAGAGRIDGAPPPAFACLVTGAAGPWTGPYAGLADAGLRAARHTGIPGVRIEASGPSDYSAALRSCAERGARITIAAGFPMAGAADGVATAFPGSQFAIVDVDVNGLAHRPRNVVGVQFAEQEAGYLVGYAAGLWAKSHHAHAVGSVGGFDVPPIERYLAGFRYGATRADPGLTTFNSFAQDAVDPAACRSKALEQIGDGSVVEFEVAGGCGSGVLSAARARGVLAVAVGTGWTKLGPWVMTSALARVDVAVESVIRAAKAGSLRTGQNDVFTAARNGIGYDAWSPRVPRAIRTAVAREAARLRAGRIRNIPTTLR
jgi:basic membrane protein A and related proteins